MNAGLFSLQTTAKLPGFLKAGSFARIHINACTASFVAYILGFFVFFQPASGYHHAFADGCNHQAVAVCITCFF